MKIFSCMAVMAIVIFVRPVFAGETFTANTPDNEVLDKLDVQIKIDVSKTIETTEYQTLREIQREIDALQARIDILNARKALMDAEASKVELKK